MPLLISIAAALTYFPTNNVEVFTFLQSLKILGFLYFLGYAKDTMSGGFSTFPEADDDIKSKSFGNNLSFFGTMPNLQMLYRFITGTI